MGFNNFVTVLSRLSLCLTWITLDHFVLHMNMWN